MVLSLFTYFQLFTALWPREKDTLTMFFIGDIMQHEAQLKAAYVGEGDINEPNCYNYSSYFKHIEPLYSKADIVAANIETNFAPPPYSGYPTFCSPSSLVKQIVESGFNLLFTANNHILDRGRVGVESTIELYQQLGVDYIGVYRNSAEAATNHPLIVEKGEFRVAFLNYTYGTNGVPIPKPFVVNTLDSVRIKRELKELRKLKELRDPYRESRSNYRLVSLGRGVCDNPF